MEKLLIPLFKLLLVFQAVSLISLEKITYHAWFLAESIKTLILEWRETFAEKLKLLNQLAFITNFSLLFKDMEARCQDQFLSQEFLWLILQSRLRTKSRSMHLVGEKRRRRSKRNREPTYQLTSLISILNFSLKMIRNCKKLERNTVLARC